MSNKKETAEKYIKMLKEEAIILQALEKEIASRKRRLKSCTDYLRMGKKRGFLRKISKYEYEYIGENNGRGED